MEQILSDHDRIQLDELIVEAEKRTSAQIVLAVVKRCDVYAEAPWKAFALGASIAGFLVFGLTLVCPHWISDAMAFIAVATTLAAGAGLALLTVLVPGFARLFLSAHRAEVEVRQYAESLFLSRELFVTNRRTGILLLVSMFERQVILLPDKGFTTRLTGEATDGVITSMIPLLRRNEIYRALEVGLENLVRILEPMASTTRSGAETTTLSNELIEDKGV